jgi:hypothetical protein
MEKGEGGGVFNLSKMQRYEFGEECVTISITGCTLYMILAG